MAWELCERSGFDAAGIARRVRLFELDGDHNRRLGRLLQQQVILPSAPGIVGDFMRSLQRVEELGAIADIGPGLARLTMLFTRYLHGIGTNVESFAYFEQRLLIGDIHQRMGIPQPVYQTSYRTLEYELIRNIPGAIRKQDQ